MNAEISKVFEALKRDEEFAKSIEGVCRKHGLNQRIINDYIKHNNWKELIKLVFGA